MAVECRQSLAISLQLSADTSKSVCFDFFQVPNDMDETAAIKSIMLKRRQLSLMEWPPAVPPLVIFQMKSIDESQEVILSI